MCLHPATVAGAPAAVRPVHEVGHHDVGVQVGVAVAADGVGESAGDHPGGGDHEPLGSRAAGGRDGVPLQVRQRTLHRLDVGGDHASGGGLTAEARTRR